MHLKTKTFAGEEDVIIGKNLRSLRHIKKVSQETLAEKIGVSAQQVQKYETGKNRISAVTLLHMAKILDVNIYDLYSGLEIVDKDRFITNISPEVIAVCQHLEAIEDKKKLKDIVKVLFHLSTDKP